MSAPRDRELSCARCGDAFWFRAGEQRFYAERELAPPRHCPGCREARREPEREDPRDEALEGEGVPAVCDACGSRFRLSFEPRGERPVYCAECFRYR